MEYNSIIEKCEEALAQPKEPEQEPATQEQIREAMIFNLPLYTTPPQRKPLSLEKILHLVDTHVGAPSMSYPLDNSDWINFARAIEAAHGIKE